MKLSYTIVIGLEKLGLVPYTYYRWEQRTPNTGLAESDKLPEIVPFSESPRDIFVTLADRAQHELDNCPDEVLKTFEEEAGHTMVRTDEGWVKNKRVSNWMGSLKTHPVLKSAYNGRNKSRVEPKFWREEGVVAIRCSGLRQTGSQGFVDTWAEEHAEKLVDVKLDIIAGEQRPKAGAWEVQIDDQEPIEVSVRHHLSTNGDSVILTDICLPEAKNLDQVNLVLEAILCGADCATWKGWCGRRRIVS